MFSLPQGRTRPTAAPDSILHGRRDVCVWLASHLLQQPGVHLEIPPWPHTPSAVLLILACHSNSAGRSRDHIQYRSCRPLRPHWTPQPEDAPCRAPQQRRSRSPSRRSPCGAVKIGRVFHRSHEASRWPTPHSANHPQSPDLSPQIMLYSPVSGLHTIIRPALAFQNLLILSRDQQTR